MFWLSNISHAFFIFTIMFPLSDGPFILRRNIIERPRDIILERDTDSLNAMSLLQSLNNKSFRTKRSSDMINTLINIQPLVQFYAQKDGMYIKAWKEMFKL